MFHISVLLKKYYVTFLYSAHLLVFWEHDPESNFYFPLIEIWDQKWIYLECLFPSPFLQLPLSISRAVSLMIYSGILVLLLLSSHHTDLFNLVNSFLILLISSSLFFSLCLQFHWEVCSSTMPMIIFSHMCLCSLAAVLEFPQLLHWLGIQWLFMWICVKIVLDF